MTSLAAPLETPLIDADHLVESYNFNLRPENIAQQPSERRDESRLLVVHRGTERVEHRHFRDLPDYLSSGDLIVANDTRVLPSRLFGRKVGSGGRVEILALDPLPEPGVWAAMVRPSKKVRPGTEVELYRRGDEGDIARVLVGETLPDGLREVRGLTPAVFDRMGEMPLPPYISRDKAPGSQDVERYQTVYANELGAAAAPTAGLHFTKPLIQELEERGVSFERVTLHVGAGTFQPVRVDNITQHVMHKERFRVPERVAHAVDSCRRRGGKLLSIGTTSCRSLETWHRLGEPQDGALRQSDLFLHPGSPAQLPMSLLTNFHLPKSTLLMLVASFLGRERTLALYEEAQLTGYRFYSYGDAMLVL